MVSGFVELALRIGTALLLPMVIGYWGVYLAEIAAWIGAGICGFHADPPPIVSIC
jgi:hypothetical protein